VSENGNDSPHYFFELGCFIKQVLKLLFFLPLTMSLENMS